MNIKAILTCAVLTGAFAISSTAWACDSAGKNTHIGSLMTVDAAQNTFTIKDAQSRSPITFVANTEIIEGLKDAKGSIMVNYKEDGESLTAVGVTF